MQLYSFLERLRKSSSAFDESAKNLPSHAVPQEMKRAMAKQAEAERERRAKVINAQGEYQASTKLAAAAEIIQEFPIAMQLRYLQTVSEIAAENNSTTLFPIPIDLFKPFLEPGAPADEEARTRALKVASDLAAGLSGGEGAGQLESGSKKMIGIAAEDEATDKLLAGTEKVLTGPDDTE